MKNDDIEILDDFSDSQMPNNNSVEDLNRNQSSLEPNVPTQPASSIDEFEKMVNEAQNMDVNPSPVQPPNYVANNNNVDPNMNSYNQYNGGIINDNYNDVNNNLVQPNEQNDLTITAVYPNGFAVDQKEEVENTQVIKPKKKNSGDLLLIIIVTVLAITLVVLLIVFYVL